MSAKPGDALRVGVVGATGALGTELLSVLEASSLRVADVVPIATDASLGSEIEFQGDAYPVLTEAPRLGALDVVFLCAPAPASLEYIREALREEVLCIDASGALAGSDEVEPRVAAFGAPADGAKLVVAAPGAALPWALVLRPLAEAAGIERAVVTALEGASWGGRPGSESLFRETLAVLNQSEFPEPEVFPGPVAFDAIPTLGEVGDDGVSARERTTAAALSRLLGGARVALHQVQVPTFVGTGGTLSLQTSRPLDAKRAAEILGQAPGVEVWTQGPEGPSLRDAGGREEVLVGRLRPDPSVEHGLLLWIAADALRVAAANVVGLAVARLGRHH